MELNKIFLKKNIVIVYNITMAQREQYYMDEDYDTQDGGWKGRGSRAGKYRKPAFFGLEESAVRKLRKKIKSVPFRKPKPDMEAVERTPDAYRTYIAEIGGEKLVGAHTGRIVKGEKKTGSGELPTRHFHGKPRAAASKVITSMRKRKELEEGEEVKIKMIEFTKGYRNAKGQRFEYEYFGKYKATDPEFPQTMTRGGEDIDVKFHNIVVPTRHKSNMDAALAASHAKGAKVKAAKVKAAEVKAAKVKAAEGEK